MGNILKNEFYQNIDAVVEEKIQEKNLIFSGEFISTNQKHR